MGKPMVDFRVSDREFSPIKFIGFQVGACIPCAVSDPKESQGGLA
jgi:hypothetical protein